MFFTFPEDARWNPDRMAVEFGVEIGEYQGVVRIPRTGHSRMVHGERNRPRKLRFTPQPRHLVATASVRLALARRLQRFDRAPDPRPYEPTLVIAAVEHQILKASRF